MVTRILAPLLDPWPGPYGGVPPWDAIDPEAFPSAFEAAIADTESEVDAIVACEEPPSFDNTIVALERRGRALDRLGSLFGVHGSNLNTGPIADIQRTVGPLLSAHGDRVVQNQALFARIEEVARAAEDSGAAGLDGPSRRLLADVHSHFVRLGARLDDDAKAELADINQRLAGLYVDFRQNILADEAEQVTWIDDEASLAGLPPSVVAALAATAARHHGATAADDGTTGGGDRGAWAVANTRSAMDPVLTLADDRDLRERVWHTYYHRGQGLGVDGDGRGAGGDNRPVIRQILSLRARRAHLLGYASHAHWRLEKEMAGTPEAAMDLLLRVWAPALQRARDEVADMERLAGHPIEPWDHRYWAEKVRRETYAIDSAEIEPYLQLEKLIEAMHWCANRLYGLRFELLPDGSVPVFHPDVRVWEVTGPEGTHVALWYLDPYARAGKSSGAWMTAYRSQERLDGPVTTLVSNNSNFVKPPGGGSPSDPGQPVLVSWTDATTLFHEFGHALHGILSDVTYPSQSGTSVARDYVEFPSQLNEHWLGTTEVLQRFCRHHETDEPMPADLIERIRAAENFNQGFDTVEYLASALYDMRIHLEAGDGRDGRADDIDPLAFERDLMAELGLPAQIVMRHRPTHFAHVFAGDGYSAAYYSYLWADALTADAAEAFTEAGGFFDTGVAARLHRHVLSAGDTVDPADGFRAFRGRDVDPDALLRKRGLA